LTARYNPHRIEKQAKKWPASFSTASLNEDIRQRCKMLWNELEHAWIDPSGSAPAIDRLLIEEYGIDAARIAHICAQGSVPATSLLESCFKWLARLDRQFNQCESRSFSAAPWLEAALQSYDHIIGRSSAYCGFSQIRRALREASPGQNLNQLQKELIISAVYPYCPLWARFNLTEAAGMPLSMPWLIQNFSEFACIRFALPGGGWHWKVFARGRFDQNPVGELLKLRWVKKAAGNRPVNIKNLDEGLQICFA